MHQQFNKQMIAETIKQHRMRMGFTQKELAEQTHVSLRSIQRIENAQVMPRMQTLKILSDFLQFDLAKMQKDVAPSSASSSRKYIITAGLLIIPILLFAAFMAQHPSFPETDFEAFVSWAILLGLIAVMLWVYWKPTR